VENATNFVIAWPDPGGEEGGGRPAAQRGENYRSAVVEAYQTSPRLAALELESRLGWK